MRDRDAGQRRRRERRADPWDHLEGNARCRQRERLLAAAPEHERITALEADDALAARRGAREEAVDREVVSILNSREGYLESLLSLAALKAGLDLIPASPFLRKRHLQKRVAALLKEVSMSRFRLTSSLAAFAAVLTLTTWLGVRSFPLQAAPQETDS